MTILTANQLAVGYDGKIVCDHINFQVEEGDYVCIIGENGAGKSTLLKTLLGLNQPMEGSIVFAENLQKKEIGYLPQQTIVQRDFPASVEEIVLSGFQGKMGLRPFYNHKERKKAKENMETMQIADLAKKCYRELSGGQQQRVLLARALCATERLLLLDEPVSGLDPRTMVELYQLIQKLNDAGITIIMISHDISMSMQYAKHVLYLGHHSFFGTKEEYEKSEIGKKFSQLQEMEEKE